MRIFWQKKENGSSKCTQDIIVDITHEKLDKIFQYRIPKEMEGRLQTGMEVLIPFGRANRETKGYVIGFSEKCNYDPEKIKEITQISQNHIAIEAKLVALAAWMKEHYGGTMIQALKTVLPIKQQEKQKEQRSIRLLLDRREAKERLSYFLSKNQTARARVVAALLDRPILPYEYVTRQLKVTAAVLRAMEEQRILQIEAEVVYRNPVTAKRTKQQSFCYTEAQQAAIHTFCEEYRRGKTGNLSRVWCDWEWKDRSLHGNDRACDRGRKAGDRFNPGDCLDLSDGHAVLPEIWRPGVNHQFQAVKRGAVRSDAPGEEGRDQCDDRSPLGAVYSI